MSQEAFLIMMTWLSNNSPILRLICTKRRPKDNAPKKTKSTVKLWKLVWRPHLAPASKRRASTQDPRIRLTISSLSSLTSVITLKKNASLLKTVTQLRFNAHWFSMKGLNFQWLLLRCTTQERQQTWSTKVSHGWEPTSTTMARRNSSIFSSRRWTAHLPNSKRKKTLRYSSKISRPLKSKLLWREMKMRK